MKDRLARYIKAGYPGLFMVTHEEHRFQALLRSVVEDLNANANSSAAPWGLHFWSCVTGRIDMLHAGASFGEQDPSEVLAAVMSSVPERTILLLADLKLFYHDHNPVLIRQLKEALFVAKSRNICLVQVGATLELPADLEKLFVVVDFDLPTKAEIREIIVSLCAGNGYEVPDSITMDAALDAASGLTTGEAEDALSLSLIESGSITPSILAREKASTIRKNGILEVISSPKSLSDIGGLDNLKSWLLKRRHAFGPDAEEYGLPTPKGICIIGIPGTGKSLTSKAVSTAFGGLPLLRLDAGRVFGSMVGQSESNMRTVFKTAEAIAPCVLWIDEIEKAFSGTQSSGSTDGGTTARVFGSMLQWMNDKTKPIFVVATANDVTKLPPEFLRKGRFDEMFFVDLPSESEREAIWRIQINKSGRDASEYDIARLAKDSEGFTGSEIEAIVSDGLYKAFDDGKREPVTGDLLILIKECIPLSKMMESQIQSLREWSKGRARSASSMPQFSSSTSPKPRRIAA